MSCLVLSKTDGRQVLKLADDLTITAQIKIIYYYWNIVFSFTCMTLNALNCFVIIRNPNPLINISPVLYLFIGYQYFVTIYIGFIKINNPTSIYFMNRIEYFIGVASWNMVVAQLVFRLLVIKYNEQLHGRRLFLFLTCFVVFIFIHFLAVISEDSNELLHEDFNEVTRLSGRSF
ncbi:hypothetical protein M3Y98_01198200 [Aphelenchoides besseyi]|nr:hypothetical protein M3Y98_01198200 [Aphelenchoides besseyi]